MGVTTSIVSTATAINHFEVRWKDSNATYWTYDTTLS